MIPTCIYIAYLWVLLVQDRVVALLRFAGSMGDLSLVTTGDYYYYYYHKTKNKMVERNWRSGRDMVWVLVGVTGCVPWPWGIAWLHCFPCLCQLRTVRCMNPGQVTDLLSRAHACLWERKGLLLSCHGLWLFLDWLIGGGDRWRSKHDIEATPQVWGLDSKFGQRPGTLDRSGTGWSHLCLGCKWDICFSGYPAGHIDLLITVSTWRYDLTTLWHRSKNWHMKDEKMALIA
jgi:hypothetical protein